MELKSVAEVCIDETNRLVSTPAYMYNGQFHEIQVRHWVKLVLTIYGLICLPGSLSQSVTVTVTVTLSLCHAVTLSLCHSVTLSLRHPGWSEQHGQRAPEDGLEDLAVFSFLELSLEAIIGSHHWKALFSQLCSFTLVKITTCINSEHIAARTAPSTSFTKENSDYR